MFTKALVASALLASLIVPLAANAGEVENRVHNQQARINQGVRNGSMTFREYNQTESRLDHIQAQRNRDLRMNGGHLTRGEHAQLNREENHLSNRISFDKHNQAHQP
ncbi:MAG: hypothetical protein ABR975_10865 [Vulcanimicrobiaceae bacterium]|jgi:hypothetical protein